VSIVAKTGHVSSDEAPSAPDSDAPVFNPVFNQISDPALDKVSELALDMTAIQQRYPLLRNAL
jgi:hypothetical protein